MVKQITKWETEDGGVFDTVKEARAWERYINFSQKLQIIAENDTTLEHKDIIYEFICDNYKELKKLFEDYKDMEDIPSTTKEEF
ncbi:hypothetical protein LCGC14_0224950 [marine sediment metagenome]|uniref:Uncharacterized protein n=1 Tax=marine sediment metagenome TaxID=412755 RepID=A0A0F9WX00_9ZZZZ